MNIAGEQSAVRVVPAHIAAITLACREINRCEESAALRLGMSAMPVLVLVIQVIGSASRKNACGVTEVLVTAAINAPVVAHYEPRWTSAATGDTLYVQPTSNAASVTPHVKHIKPEACGLGWVAGSGAPCKGHARLKSTTRCGWGGWLT